MTRLDAPPRDPAHRTRERVYRARRRRVGLLGALIIVAAVFAYAASHVASHPRPSGTMVSLGRSRTLLVPTTPGLSPLRRRIVALAESEIGYQTDPTSGYCNKFSAHFQSGAADCPAGELSEEWCADFAAWTWQQAGAEVVYQYVNGDLNSSAASFYEWGVAHGTWHPVGSGYRPEPGDVAVYGLDPSTLVATHVAVVIGRLPGAKGPIAVNGDGDLTAHSIVEVRSDELDADVHPTGAPLSGYVSPTP